MAEIKFTMASWLIKGLAAPVLADEGKQSVLDPVPLAGARRKMAHRDVQAGFIGQLLQFQLPEPYPCAVATARSGGNQQALGLAIEVVGVNKKEFTGVTPAKLHQLNPGPYSVHSRPRALMSSNQIRASSVLLAA